MNARDGNDANEATAFLVCTMTACAISVPALVAGLALGRLLRFHRSWLALGALAGVALTALLHQPILAEMQRAWDLSLGARQPQWAEVPADVWPSVRTWWLLALPLAPAIGLVFEALRAATVQEQHERRERHDRHRRERRERRARRAVGAEKPARWPPGVALGHHVEGERLLPVCWRRVRLPL